MKVSKKSTGFLMDRTACEELVSLLERHEEEKRHHFEI
jgi:hypothetical protein